VALLRGRDAVTRRRYRESELVPRPCHGTTAGGYRCPRPALGLWNLCVDHLRSGATRTVEDDAVQRMKRGRGRQS
jgi:hypothetical protein